MSNSGKRKRVVLSRQTLPAMLFVTLGALMMAMPFIVEHGGYADDIMIARDGMDAPFDKTLILIGQESMDGAIGIILNKPLSDDQQAKLSPFMRDSGIPVGYGGPLEVSEKIFVLEETKMDPKTHKSKFEIWTWDAAVRHTPDLLNKIRRSIKKGEQRYRVFTGFVGWGLLQLEDEALLKNAWHSHTATHELLFQTSPAMQWDALDREEKAKEAAAGKQI